VLGVGVLAAFALAGCQKDEEIRHYTVPKPAVAADDSSAGPARQRLLGAIFDRGEEKWFVKLTGPEQAVGGHEAEFDDFVRSFRFQGAGERPTWKAPEGWHAGPPTQFSAASYRLVEGEGALQLTVTRATGSALANVNRWRGQLGLPEVGADELGKVGHELKVDGTPVTRVDFSGTAGKTPRRPPFASGLPPGHPEPRRAGLKYTKPEGWQDLGPAVRNGISLDAVLRAGEGERAPEVTVSRAGGSLEQNVNRWRGQLGLGPAGPDELKKDAKAVEVAGEPAPYFDFAAPGAGGKRILGVILRRGGEGWFFKMVGPADAVAGQKAAFEAFVRSVRFDAGEGAGE
jgi:hypothetical protein